MGVGAGTPVVRGRKFLSHRPGGIVEDTRWLFAWLALISMSLLLPGIVTTARGGLLALGVGAALVLAASWISGYRRRTVWIWHDLVDIVGILGLAVVCPEPRAIVLVVFGSLWFRSLYGTGGQAVARGLLYAVSLGALLLAWRSFHLDPSKPEFSSFLGIVPIMFFTVLIARKHTQSLSIREQGVNRDRALAATGSLLLDAVGKAEILKVGWEALTEFCVATPGLRVIQVGRDGSVLTVDGAAGDFMFLRETFPAEILAVDGGNARICDPVPLNRAVGTPLMWKCLNLSADGEDGWLLVGAPKSIPDEAILSIRTLVTQIVLALRNSQAYRELAAQARMDALTGLDNRASFTRQLSEILDESVRPDSLHLMFIDLDDFKDINDGLGHRVGDDLLIEVASRLRDGIRSEDLCARLGGDEFAVLLRETTSLHAVAFAKRLVVELAAPYVLDEHHVGIGASIGITTFTTGTGLKELVHQADIAMYAAKAHGKNHVEIFHPALLQIDRRQESVALI
jgi:diguanylate cyclase (GGDEF)-like protein